MGSQSLDERSAAAAMPTKRDFLGGYRADEADLRERTRAKPRHVSGRDEPQPLSPLTDAGLRSFGSNPDSFGGLPSIESGESHFRMHAAGYQDQALRRLSRSRTKRHPCWQELGRNVLKGHLGQRDIPTTSARCIGKKRRVEVSLPPSGNGAPASASGGRRLEVKGDPDPDIHRLAAAQRRFEYPLGNRSRGRPAEFILRG